MAFYSRFHRVDNRFTKQTVIDSLSLSKDNRCRDLIMESYEKCLYLWRTIQNGSELYVVCNVDVLGHFSGQIGLGQITYSWVRLSLLVIVAKIGDQEKI